MSAVRLVTGAAGLVGFELVRQLLDSGVPVVAVDRDQGARGEELQELAERSSGRLTVIRGELAGVAREELQRSFAHVYHLAAVLGVRHVEENPFATLSDNLQSTLAVLELVREHGCERLLFASSSEVYASGVAAGTVPLPTPEGVPLGISDPALPRWAYAASKIAGEAAVFAAAQDGGFLPLVARLHNVYGPRMAPTHVIPELMQRCREKRDPLVVYGPEQTRAFLHVEDAARALARIADSATASGVYHVGSDEETRIEDLAQLVLEISGHRPEIERLDAPPGSVRRRLPDIDRLRGLGFEPRIPLREGLRDCWSG